MIFFHLSLFFFRNELHFPPSCLIPPVWGALTRAAAVVVGVNVLLYLAKERGGCFASNDFVVAAFLVGRARCAAVFIL